MFHIHPDIYGKSQDISASIFFNMLKNHLRM